MASEERSWPPWTRIALRLALFAVLFTVSAVARHNDTRSHASPGPPDGYTANFPLKGRHLLQQGVDVYYFHDSVGHVVETAVQGDHVFVRVLIDAESREEVERMNSVFRLYRDKQDPTQGWITVIPRDSEDRPMTPDQAAKAFGRTA